MKITNKHYNYSNNEDIFIVPDYISVYADHAMDKQISSAYWSYLQKWVQHCQNHCAWFLARVIQLWGAHWLNCVISSDPKSQQNQQHGHISQMLMSEKGWEVDKGIETAGNSKFDQISKAGASIPIPFVNQGQGRCVRLYSWCTLPNHISPWYTLSPPPGEKLSQYCSIWPNFQLWGLLHPPHSPIRANFPC